MKALALPISVIALFVVGCSSGSSSSTNAAEAPAPKATPLETKTATAPPVDAKATKVDPSTDISEAELGVPFYPGSELDAKGNNFKNVTDLIKDYETARTTSDSPKQVADFYVSKVKDGKATGGGDTMMVSGKTDSGATFSLVASKKDGKTAIMVSTVLKK